MNEDYEKIMGVIADAETIAIAGHINPDGDSIGACYAMAQCAAKMWKSVFVLIDDHSEIFDCIPGADFKFTGDPASLRPDLFIALDCASKERLKNPELFDNCEITVSIDHHVSNTRFARYNYVLDEASSTCEVLFGLISMYIPIDRETAASLYSGMVFDTGGFRHANATAETHEIAARLIGMGIDHSKLYNKLMNERSLTEAKCFGKALGNLKLVNDGRIAVGSLSHGELESLGATGKDVEGIAEYMLGVRGAEVSVFAYAKSDGETKISFRSKNIDVGKIAAGFGGGGHNNAAGCNIAGDAVSALEKAVEAVVIML